MMIVGQQLITSGPPPGAASRTVCPLCPPLTALVQSGKSHRLCDAAGLSSSSWAQCMPALYKVRPCHPVWHGQAGVGLCSLHRSYQVALLASSRRSSKGL